MWEFFQAGGPLMWPLLLCSIISLTIILERFWFWFRLRLRQDVDQADAILSQVYRDKKATPQIENPGIICRVLIAGLSCASEATDKAMEISAMHALNWMRRGMNLLDTIITVAPMLGIIGTVLGIIGAFDSLTQSGISDPRAVIGGIAEALITTATGLAISVLTVFPYNYFNTRIEHTQDILEMYATHLLINLGESNSEGTQHAAEH